MTQVSKNLFRENEFRENNSVIRLGLPYPKRYNNLTGGSSLDNLDRDLLIGESSGSIVDDAKGSSRRKDKGVERKGGKTENAELPLDKRCYWRIILLI